MKFKNYLTNIDNVSIYPMVTLILFITIFLLAAFLIFSKSKKTIDEIKQLPLED